MSDLLDLPLRRDRALDGNLAGALVSICFDECTLVLSTALNAF